MTEIQHQRKTLCACNCVCCENHHVMVVALQRQLSEARAAHDDEAKVWQEVFADLRAEVREAREEIERKDEEMAEARGRIAEYALHHKSCRNCDECFHIRQQRRQTVTEIEGCGPNCRPHRCPVCNGQGIVSKPFHVPGDVQTWVGDGKPVKCRPCNGTGVIWRDHD